MAWSARRPWGLCANAGDVGPAPQAYGFWPVWRQEALCAVFGNRAATSMACPCKFFISAFACQRQAGLNPLPTRNLARRPDQYREASRHRMLHPASRVIHFQKEKIRRARPSMNSNRACAAITHRGCGLIAASPMQIGAVRCHSGRGDSSNDFSGGGRCTNTIAFHQMQKQICRAGRQQDLDFDMAPDAPQGFLQNPIHRCRTLAWASAPRTGSIETQVRLGCVEQQAHAAAAPPAARP